MNHPRRSAPLALVPVALIAVTMWQYVAGDGLSPGDRIAWAQESSCGNAILEPGEECDPPGSLSCPPGSPTGALPCGSDCTCPVEQALDHFQCYAVKRRAFPNQSVTVQDQFGTMDEVVRRPEQLCVPSDKDDEGISDPTDHLTAHAVKAPDFERRPDQTVVDQFGTLLLDVTRVDHLMVPTGKDGVAQQPPLDHFQCYKVKRSTGGPKFVKRTVSIANQIETTTVELIRPVRLCAPANKNGEDATAPTHPDHLLCYRTKGSKFGEEEHTITSQFGTRSVLVIQRQHLCVPALKNPGATTTTVPTTSTTSTSTTSPTTSTTSTSTTSPTTSTSTTSTTPTTSSTTTTTIYGSPSRAFLQPSSSLLD